jgi:hypothetical protein
LRCRDYHLLKHVTVEQRLEAAAAWDWQAVERHSFSEIIDLGYIEDLGRGYAAPMRVVVVRTPEKLHQAKVGKRVKQYVYELFVSSQSSASLSALDLLSLYRGRGGFEQQLSEEDQEQDYDRWCSWHPEGQEFWQILGQWSWNWRVWMGWQQRKQVRQTIWAAAEREETSPGQSAGQIMPDLPPSLMFLQGTSPETRDPELDEASVVNCTEEAGNCYGPMQVSTEWGRGLGKGKRFGNEDFQIVDEDSLICPAGHVMHRCASRQKANGDLALQFGINQRTCQRCGVKKQCLAPQSKGVRGRRITLIRRVVSQSKAVMDRCSATVRSAIQWVLEPQPKYEQAIYWCDIAAGHLRRGWHEHLRLQEVKVEVIVGSEQSKEKQLPPLLTRQQRAHHRLGWWERWERNERRKEERSWNIMIYGGGAIMKAMQLLAQRSFISGG